MKSSSAAFKSSVSTADLSCRLLLMWLRTKTASISAPERLPARLRGAESGAAARDRSQEAGPEDALDGRTVLRVGRAGAEAHGRKPGGAARQAGDHHPGAVQTAGAREGVEIGRAH